MILENSRLLVEIADLGAEVIRIHDKKMNRELLWEGEATFWKRHSPILFPNVGKTFGNEMRFGGKVYATSQHGFARDRVFDVVEQTDTTALYALKSDEETLKRYPFAFELYVGYALSEAGLKVTWRVHNPAEETMYFTIGAHPAFRFAEFGDTKDAYSLYFPGKADMKHILVDLSTGTAVPDVEYELKLEDGYLPLNEEMFSRDAMIFDGGQIEEAWLCAADHTPLVGMISKGFPNYGVWSVKDAPFVCLEPWMGRCDNFGFTGNFSEKNDVNVLMGGDTFEKSYTIVVPK